MQKIASTPKNHIRFHGEFLVFEFAKSKVHQKGEKNLGPWHFYANPSKMWFCPGLSLSLFIFCYPDLLKGDVPIFNRKSYYTQYDTRLTKIVKHFDTQLKILGFKS